MRLYVYDVGWRIRRTKRYTLAGHLSCLAESGSKVELHYNDRSVFIYEAESEEAVEDFGDFTPTKDVQSLIPSVDYNTLIDEISIVIVQLTTFSCGGIRIGLAISHIMADIPSALHFVNE